MNNQQQTNPDRIISRPQFRDLTGISRTTEWRLAQEGRLPDVVKINGHVLGYLESAYSDWLKQYSERKTLNERKRNNRGGAI